MDVILSCFSRLHTAHRTGRITRLYIHSLAMAPLSQLLSFALLLAASSLASPTSLEKRAAIDHDAVVGFPQTVPSGTLGQLYLKYKPYLKVVNGCVPFPAVDAQGNTKYV